MSSNLDEKTTIEDEYDKEKYSKTIKDSPELDFRENSFNQDKSSSLNQSFENNDKEDENNEIRNRLRKNPKKTVLPYSSEDLNKFEKKKKSVLTDLKDDDYKLFKNIVEKMKSNPKSIYFRQAAVRQFENKRDKDIYKSVISHPMDLSHVIKKINNVRYATYQEFYDDLFLIWENAQLFNQSGSTIYDDAEFLSVDKEKMPRFKTVCTDKHKGCHSRERSKQVADQHGTFFVPLIAECSCKYAHKHIWGIGANR